MTNYYKAKTRGVDILDYRKYILARSGENLNSNSTQLLEMDIYNSYPHNPHDYLEAGAGWYENHPLVNKGLAFWVDKTNICIGYNIGEVFRPIFSHARERQAYGVRKCIVLYAKIFASKARHALYKKELMELHNKKIPDEIIEHIAGYTWDIMLLL